MLKNKICLALFCVLWGLVALAEIKVDPVFSSNMMFQQEQPIAFFGSADPGEKVDVEFAGKRLSVNADAAGIWRAEFPARKASGKALTVTVSGNAQKIVLENVIVGDVWVCAGQSNMEMPVGWKFKRGWSAAHCEDEVKKADYPAIRVVDQANVWSHNQLLPAKCTRGGWEICSPQTAGNFSATGYFFARQLYADLKIPIGLIDLTYSGSRIEPWISVEGYRKANLKRDLDVIQKYALMPDAKKKPEAGRAAPPYNNCQFYCNLYNGMVDAWTKLPVKGVIWYQGCSNAGEIHYYKLHQALIADWRSKWHQEKMPFILVQLAGFGDVEWQIMPPLDAPYALTRDIQAQMLALENIGMATAIDVGEPDNIHPAGKQAVGYRLALEAERMVYGKKILSRGPLFDHAEIEGEAIRIFFQNVPNGLKTGDGKRPGAFAIAGADKQFVWAEAKIDGKTVVVRSPEVKAPQFVRYAYVGYRGDCNLMNQEGLPACPFRSDAVDYRQAE